MTGAQIIDEIERLSMGFWRPSPGSVYPALEELEADGLIKVARLRELRSITRSLIVVRPLLDYQALTRPRQRLMTSYHLPSTLLITGMY